MSTMNEKTRGVEEHRLVDSSEHDSRRSPVSLEKNEKTRSSPKSSEKFSDLMSRIWAYEILSLVVSLAALGGLIGLLAAINNKPLTSWDAHISPNTVISILATISKAALLGVVGACIAQLRWVHYRQAPQRLGDLDVFASASKGVVGSAKMVWGLSKKHNSGRVACFGAFLVMIAIAFDPFSQQVLRYQVQNGAVPGLAATIPVAKGVGNSSTILNNNAAWKGLYAGLLGFEYPIPYQCTSGNCTWPTFATLGVCADCQVSPPLTSLGQNSTTIQVTVGNLSMSLDNGVQNTLTSLDEVESYTLVKSVISSAYPNGATEPAIFEFLIAQLLVDTTSKPSNFTPTWNVTMCSINWCGRVYEDVQVTKGNLSQPAPTMVELQPDPQSNCTDPSNLCQEFIADSPLINETYRINFRPDAQDIRELLNFNQDVNAFANNTWDITDALSVTATLFWNINVTSAFDKACDTFTDFFRAQHPVELTGTTLATTTFFRVRWGWLALPAAVIFCSIVLLILVICINKGTMLWKASSVPLLLHPLDYNGHEHMRPTDARKGMSEQANAIQAKLVHGDDGKTVFSVTHEDRSKVRTDLR